MDIKSLKLEKKKLKETNTELEELRERLRDLINEKHDYEEWIDATYSFLHGMLGSQEMEKLDEELLDKGEFYGNKYWCRYGKISRIENIIKTKGGQIL